MAALPKSDRSQEAEFKLRDHQLNYYFNDDRSLNQVFLRYRSVVVAKSSGVRHRNSGVVVMVVVFSHYPKTFPIGEGKEPEQRKLQAILTQKLVSYFPSLFASNRSNHP